MDFLLGGGDFSKPADTSFLGRAVRNHSLSHQLYFFKKACKKKKKKDVTFGFKRNLGICPEEK